MRFDLFHLINVCPLQTRTDRNSCRNLYVVSRMVHNTKKNIFPLFFQVFIVFVFWNLRSLKPNFNSMHLPFVTKNLNLSYRVYFSVSYDFRRRQQLFPYAELTDMP